MTDYKRTERACYLGYINQAITVNLLALFFLIFRTDYGISYTGLGTIIFIIFFVQIAVDVCDRGDVSRMRSFGAIG